MKTYEWDLEAHDNDGALWHDFRDALKAADLNRHLFQYTPKTLASDPVMNLVLVQNIGNEDDGLTDRGWAYVTFDSGTEMPTLPSHFDNGQPVPKRFQAHLNKWAVSFETAN